MCGSFTLLFVCLFLILASILVIPPSFPSASSTRGAVTMINVHFFNLPNITVGDVQGVERISFDTWRACYYAPGVDGSCGNATRVIGGQYEPYSLTIYNNGQQVTASAAWSIVLAAQFFGGVMIFIGAVVLVLYTRCYRTDNSNCEFQYQYERSIGPNRLPDPNIPRATRTRWKWGHYRRAITLWILFSVWLSMWIVLAIDLGTYRSIANRMLSLGSGGTQRIETTIGPGLILNMVICGFLTFALFLKLLDKGYNWKSNQYPKGGLGGEKMPSQWHCTPLLDQYYEDCYHMECYKWCP